MKLKSTEIKLTVLCLKSKISCPFKSLYGFPIQRNLFHIFCNILSTVISMVNRTWEVFDTNQWKFRQNSMMECFFTHLSVGTCPEIIRNRTALSSKYFTVPKRKSYLVTTKIILINKLIKCNCYIYRQVQLQSQQAKQYLAKSASLLLSSIPN